MTEQRLEEQLTDLAATVAVGPPPMAELLAGGRRRLRRRRASAVAVTLAACVALGGTTVLGLNHRGSGAATVQPAAPPSPTVQTAHTFGPIDPFTPVRAMVGQGTAGGKHWQAWVARWPAATEDQSWRQARLIWQEQHAAGGSMTEPTEKFAREYWQDGYDRCDLYVVVDGVRQPLDVVMAVPGRASELYAKAADLQPGSLLGQRAVNSPNGPGLGLGSTSIAFVEVAPETARAVVHHADGSTLELRPTALGDASVHWIAFARSEATQGSTLQLYASDGRLLGSSERWFT